MINHIKIIFIDLDGTLLNDESTISFKSKEVIKELVNKGINVILCSGRANTDTIRISKEINATPIVISNNGAIIYNYETDNKIFESPITQLAIKEIWDSAINDNIGITLNSTYKRFKNNKSFIDANIIDKVEEIEENVTQIVLNTDSYESLIKMKSFIEENHKDMESKNIWSRLDKNKEVFEMDISKKFNNKGEAIRRLLNKLNIKREQAMCFGDQENDISMFNECGIKIAMKNGCDKLKRMADYVTDFSNNDDGVVNFLIGKKWELY